MKRVLGCIAGLAISGLATAGLDDIQLRELASRLAYLRDLEDRRIAVRKSIAEQGKLTAQLQAAIDEFKTRERRYGGAVADDVLAAG